MQTWPRPCVIMKAIVSGRDLLGRGDEVTLVLSIFIIDHDDDPALPEGLESVFDL